MAGINKFEELLKVVQGIGILVSEQTRKHLSKLDGEGIEIDDNNPVIETEDGFFDIAPNGDVLRVVIFINQKNARGHPDTLTAEDWHKFHLYPCTTIRNFPISRRYRYKKTNNTQGLFQYIIIYNNTEYNKVERLKGRRLNLCKNCQKMLPSQFKKYPIVQFPLEEFYQDHPQSEFIETFEFDHDQIPRLYAKNWHKIATHLKEKRNWHCEQCHLDLSDNKKYLEAHHINGNPAHNAVANLKALCIACHAKQTMHEHIKHLPTYKEFANLYP